jgi:hypothetical protein
VARLTATEWASGVLDVRHSSRAVLRPESGLIGSMILKAFFYFFGGFTLLLGVVHFFTPILFDFKNAIPFAGIPLKILHLGPLRYRAQRRDVYGIALVMNYAVSYMLVTIGCIDVLWRLWITTPWAGLILIWIAIFWLFRAGSQFHLGRRNGDWAIAIGFFAIAVVHAGIVIFL